MKDDSIAKREVRKLKREVRKLKREREDLKDVLDKSVDALQGTLDALLRSHKHIMQKHLKEPPENLTSEIIHQVAAETLVSHKHIMQKDLKEPPENLRSRVIDYMAEILTAEAFDQGAAEILAWFCGKPPRSSRPGLPETIPMSEGARRTVLKSIYSDFDLPTRFRTFEDFHGACDALIEYWKADWVHSWSLPELKRAVRFVRRGVALPKHKGMKKVLKTASPVALDILEHFRLVERHFGDYWEREERSFQATTVRNTKRKR